MEKITLKELLSEIDELKKRVIELERRPQYIPYPVYPSQPIIPVTPWSPSYPFWQIPPTIW